MRRYKFLNLKEENIISSYNENFKWKIGKWYKTDDKLIMCGKGFHCSKTPLDALRYVPGEVLAIVEVKGKSIKQKDKECWEEMRIKKAYRWTKKDSLKLAIYSAELVLGNFEKEYPEDNRPRKAIEIAKKVLKEDTEKNRLAAEVAARAAWATARAAWATARAAWATEAAEAAAWAAEAARSVIWAAEAAARAAWSKKPTIEKKVNRWFINHIEDLELIGEA